jgi:hypothetical protein
MRLPALAGAAAAAALTLSLGAPMANAADTRAASGAAPASASDCWWTHYWDGFWHHHARLVCDHDYYYDSHGFYHDRDFRDRDFRDHDFRGENRDSDDRDKGAGTAERGTTERGTTDRGTTDRGNANATPNSGSSGGTMNPGGGTGRGAH